jgi:RimJ/RimL family protein N-acetyltransferase
MKTVAMPVRLRDGRMIVLRPMTARDGDALRDAVERADSFDLYRRFMGRPPPTQVLVRMLGHADGIHDAVLGAFGIDGRLVGVAQFDREDDEPTAELAIEVSSDWQRCGLGKIMLRELAAMAERRGITTLTAVYFADNAPLIHLLHSTGASRWREASGPETTAELDIGKLLIAARTAGLVDQASAQKR